MATDPGWERLADFGSGEEADLAKQALEAEGIHVRGGGPGGSGGPLVPGSAGEPQEGIALFVPAAELALALRTLDALETNSEIADGGGV
jgi:hypothetical protein